MIKTEKRFRDGGGEKYMSDGQRVRCQSQSKNKLREWRIEHQDWTITNDDIWPACQCPRAAVPGTFACNLHGGLTPRKNKPTSLLDVIPVDLSEKFQVLLDNPDYLSSRTDIILMTLRQWELVERLSQQVGSEADWIKVQDAMRQLDSGEILKAANLLRSALESHKTKEDVWRELYSLERIVQDLRVTETKVAKDLRVMASADQVERLMDRIFTIVIRGIEKYISDSQEQVRLMQYVTSEFMEAVNISPTTISGLLSTGNKDDY